MKQYIKDGQIKFRNQIVLHGTRTIKGKDGKEREVKTQIINPSEEMILNDGWVEYIEAEPTDRELKLREIRTLKNELSSTDYKVIKCMETVMVGGEMPYDMAELHAERQRIRDRINELEEQML